MTLCGNVKTCNNWLTVLLDLPCIAFKHLLALCCTWRTRSSSFALPTTSYVGQHAVPCSYIRNFALLKLNSNVLPYFYSENTGAKKVISIKTLPNLLLYLKPLSDLLNILTSHMVSPAIWSHLIEENTNLAGSKLQKIPPLHTHVLYCDIPKILPGRLKLDCRNHTLLQHKENLNCRRRLWFTTYNINFLTRWGLCAPDSISENADMIRSAYTSTASNIIYMTTPSLSMLNKQKKPRQTDVVLKETYYMH